PLRPAVQPARHADRGPGYSSTLELLAAAVRRAAARRTPRLRVGGAGGAVRLPDPRGVRALLRDRAVVARPVRTGGGPLRRRGPAPPGAGAEARAGRRLAVPDRRPPAPRPANGVLAAGPGGPRGRNPRGLRIDRVRAAERPGRRRRHGAGRAARRRLRGRGRGLGAAAAPRVGLPPADPA